MEGADDLSGLRTRRRLNGSIDRDEMYYPQGMNDPEYCVLRFTAKNGRFYSNFKSENFEV
jgi:hypothetical protein